MDDDEEDEYDADRRDTIRCKKRDYFPSVIQLTIDLSLVVIVFRDDLFGRFIPKIFTDWLLIVQLSRDQIWFVYLLFESVFRSTNNPIVLTALWCGISEIFMCILWMKDVWNHVDPIWSIAISIVDEDEGKSELFK